jgi:hypothetical protein
MKSKKLFKLLALTLLVLVIGSLTTCKKDSPVPVHPYIGEYFGGGIIFYINNSHGLIAATSDQSTQVPWCLDCGKMGTSSSLGTGNSNTIAIVTQCFELGIAAQICDDLILNGYDDWFLPSKDELNQMFIQVNVIGGFAGTWYWSSSDDDGLGAWAQCFPLPPNFPGGSQNYGNKPGLCNVRAVRAF